MTPMTQDDCPMMDDDDRLTNFAPPNEPISPNISTGIPIVNSLQHHDGRGDQRIVSDHCTTSSNCNKTTCASLNESSQTRPKRPFFSQNGKSPLGRVF